MASEPPGTPGPKGGPLDRFLRLFSDVRPGESTTVLLMFANVFTILVGYYVLKTIREPLVLVTGGAEIEAFSGAEVKAFSSAGQAILLMGFIPLYSWFASRVGRVRLIVGFNLFFILCIELFFLAGRAEVPYTGIVFFIWIGIFNNSVVAQFWSFANDIYSRSAGERLFPIIVVGMTAGTPVGAKAAAVLFGRGVDPYAMMQLGALALVISLVLYLIVQNREERRRRLVSSAADKPPLAAVEKPPSGRGGFSLIFQSRYLILIALTLVLANWVNTTGGYILDRLVLVRAESLPEAEQSAFVGEFMGNFMFWVNVAAVLIQAFAVSRLVKYLGIAGVVLALPVVALGVYGLIAAGAGFVVTRWAKTAENSTDYSIMNTAKAMLWLPTTPEEKYKAKQATDTFFVRIGDLLSAGLVLLGTTWLVVEISGFAAVNLALVLVWLAVAAVLVRENRRLTATSDGTTKADAA
jgi:AAA family ATP:ADP antiporter